MERLGESSAAAAAGRDLSGGIGAFLGGKDCCLVEGEREREIWGRKMWNNLDRNLWVQGSRDKRAAGVYMYSTYKLSLSVDREAGIRVKESKAESCL